MNIGYNIRPRKPAQKRLFEQAILDSDSSTDRDSPPLSRENLISLHRKTFWPSRPITESPTTLSTMADSGQSRSHELSVADLPDKVSDWPSMGVVVRKMFKVRRFSCPVRKILWPFQQMDIDTWISCHDTCSAKRTNQQYIDYLDLVLRSLNITHVTEWYDREDIKIREDAKKTFRRLKKDINNYKASEEMASV